MNKRRPLIAMTAVQALCNTTKRKLLAATIQERRFPGSSFEISAWCRSIESFSRLPAINVLGAYVNLHRSVHFQEPLGIDLHLCILDPLRGAHRAPVSQ